MLSCSFFVESRIYVPIFWLHCRFCMKANMAAGTTPAISHCDLALLNEAASKILLERGRGYHQEVVHHATNRETFQYSIQNGKKVAVTIQVFVGTKTGWFRGFCSYYVKRGEDEGEMCSGNKRGNGMRWHTRIFSAILLYIQYTPPLLLKKSWIARDWSCVCVLIARATKLP